MTFWLGVLPRRQNKRVGEEEGGRVLQGSLTLHICCFSQSTSDSKIFLKVSLFIFSKALVLGWGWREEKELEQVGVAVCMGHLN